eukprot:CAMPEP_0116858940 /NCGR_PEP_ID=MMETSP0418-20121206/21486_1 /TAXON_ID=1158023 /ORGANISM="Astrosyne radiata, Strain 13vi08-1A" /LENGTH=32 /DNA_ID= /DNA_START= /DNA_END= /DNA_ORIENTATION=
MALGTWSSECAAFNVRGPHEREKKQDIGGDQE